MKKNNNHNAYQYMDKSYEAAKREYLYAMQKLGVSERRHKTYKIYPDGNNHYIGAFSYHSQTAVPFGKKKLVNDVPDIYATKIYNLCRDIIDSELNEYEAYKKAKMRIWEDRPELYWVVKKYDVRRYIRSVRKQSVKRAPDELQEEIEKLYLEYINQKQRLTPPFEYVRQRLTHPAKDLPNAGSVIFKFIDNVRRKLNNKKRRFFRKVWFLKPNYFITLTYDEEKMTAEEFRNKLFRTLANLAYRRGWKCLAVPEYGECNGRYHFHVLARIPKGQMIGELIERNDWSTKHNHRVKTVSNTFFERKFGRNDFRKIDAYNRYSSINYVAKYVGKSNNRVRSSRGIPSEISMDIDEEYAIAAPLGDRTDRVVLWDDAFVTPFEELCLKLKLGDLTDTP